MDEDELNRIAITEATTYKQMREVWKLTYREYLKKGYCKIDKDGILCHYPEVDKITLDQVRRMGKLDSNETIRDSYSNTDVFIATDSYGTVVGTSSLTKDGSRRLPTDYSFPKEIEEIRRTCRKLGLNLGSPWRIVTGTQLRGNPFIVAQLINATVKRGEKYQLHYTTFTLNPCHEEFYKKALDLETIARIEFDESVSAPAVLMLGRIDGIVPRWNQTFSVIKRRYSIMPVAAA